MRPVTPYVVAERQGRLAAIMTTSKPADRGSLGPRSTPPIHRYDPRNIAFKTIANGFRLPCPLVGLDWNPLVRRSDLIPNFHFLYGKHHSRRRPVG
jgi:hypothetical protein